MKYEQINGKLLESTFHFSPNYTLPLMNMIFMFVKKKNFFSQIQDEFKKNIICAFMLILLFFSLIFFNKTNYERKVINII